MKKIISFCLWGKDPMFTDGAVRNAKVAPDVYPDWTCRFYIDDTVPLETVGELKRLGAEIRVGESFEGYMKEFWRAFPSFDDPDVERFISRDCDALLSEREAVAVKEWEESGKTIHNMRDHKNHTHPITGGMWGGVPSQMAGFQRILSRFIDTPFGDTICMKPEKLYFGVDTTFYSNIMYPLYEEDMLTHDDRKTIRGDELPFVIPLPNNYSFIGNKYEGCGRPVYTDES